MRKRVNFSILGISGWEGSAASTCWAGESGFRDRGALNAMTVLRFGGQLCFGYQRLAGRVLNCRVADHSLIRRFEQPVVLVAAFQHLRDRPARKAARCKKSRLFRALR